MRSLSDVKDYLDRGIKEGTLPDYDMYHMNTATITEKDCLEIENSLNCKLPEDYRTALLSYDFSNLGLGNADFYSKAELIEYNQYSPDKETYLKNRVLEFGHH